MTETPQNRSNEVEDGGKILARTTDVVYREPVTHTLDSPDEASDEGLIVYWKTVLRYKGTVLLFAFLGALGGFLYTVPQTPIYQARTAVEVQGLNDNFLNMKDVDPTATTASFDPSMDINTQVKILQSDSLRERTIEKVAAQNPSGLILPTNRFAVWKRALGYGPGESTKWRAAVASAAGSVNVRAVNATRILEIRCDSVEPKLAAIFANALVSEFIDQGLEARLNTTGKTSEWLSRQLDDLKIKLEKSEDQLQGYATAVGLQFIADGNKEGDKDNVDVEKLRVLQSETLKAQSARVEAQAKFERASKASIDSLPEVLDDASLRENRTKLSDLHRQIAELSVSLTPANPKVVKLQAQIREVEHAFDEEKINIVSRIENEYEAAARSEQMISEGYSQQLKLVNDQATNTVHYNILKREVDTNRQLYESILQKVKEAGIASAMRASSYRVVDAAQTPEAPYEPAPSRTSMLGWMGGLLVGIGFVLVRERADQTLQQPGDLKHHLGLPELGVIPADQIGSSRQLSAPAPSSLKLAQNGNGNGNGNGSGPAASGYKRRPSLLAESFQDVLTSILFSSQDGTRPQVIAICSAAPSEGKSTVSSNLALSLADINQRVLLIDADMRRPRLHHLFEVENIAGLSNFLKEKSPISRGFALPILVETKVPGMFLLPSGPAVSNASNLLYSPRLVELFRALRGEFDMILVDTPPMLQLADARIISQHCDTVIMVVRAGKTTRDVALAAKQKFDQDGTPILGTVLNDWIPGVNGYGYDAKYYDRYAKYYNIKKD
jgi:capsular exopolysaccharide synthesis family protein